jgi:outer membrane protein OmpA-like peptidoglycan-associated protein
MGHRGATSGFLASLRSAWLAVALVAASLSLTACSAVPDWANPVVWYRDVSGTSKDDPGASARNTENLKSGSEQPYPNLASVPPPPTNALSSADREKLRNSLAADRANAKYVDNNDQYTAVPPKAVPSPPLSAPASASPEQAGSAPVRAAPASPPTTASSGPARGGASPPQESSLTTPSVRSVPQGEVPRAPPPAPAGVPARGQGQGQPAQQTATLPPPSPTSLPDPAFDPAEAGGGVAGSPGLGFALGTIAFSGKSAKLSPEILQQVREVVQLRQQNGGGTVRITGYSEPEGEQETMGPQLASFNLALDRARAVAVALTRSGIPAEAVEIGASPPPPGQAGGVVEISLEP